jgi:quercetin dioxygenase-like cupin family protein
LKGRRNVPKEQDLRRETIRPGNGEMISLGPGVVLREFVGEACAARGFSTGTAGLEPGAVLPYHIHRFSEAITILQGEAEVAVEGRAYQLKPFDCLHVPANVPHEVTNPSNKTGLVALWAFASATPTRELVDSSFVLGNRGWSNPEPGHPEFIVRFDDSEVYELSPGADFRDLFAGRFGSLGICGGYGKFRPGSSLPCHVHEYDESITIVEGRATCLVKGNRYQLSGLDTAFVPEGQPHRFINQSDSPMAMIWVYAGTEPGRTLVEPSYCDGTLAWPGRETAIEITDYREAVEG